MSRDGEESVPGPPQDDTKDAAGAPVAGGEERPAPLTPQQHGIPSPHPPPGAHAHNSLRYPHSGSRGPEGYYQPMYPPPGDGTVPPYPPPRGYEGAPQPYAMHPHMPHGYPMYPYQPPMYPHYPGYPPPPMPYGYPPPDPTMGHAGYPPPRMDHHEGVGVGPYAKKDDGEKGGEGESTEGGDDEDIVPGAVTARLKTYIKPRIPTTQDVLDRRARKNAQSRSRAGKLRQRVLEIEKKPVEERTEEEQAIFLQFEARRQRKNDRSRERALEKKEEIDRILAKPEKKRTKIEKQFLDGALGAKKRKNEGDRVRRQRLKHMGLSSKAGLKSAMGRGAPMPPTSHAGYPQYPQYGVPPPPPHHMGDIPMSPIPGQYHPHMQSPGGFGSPGMVPGMGYPSPQNRRGPGGLPGVMETSGRPSTSGGAMSYIPPAQGYDNHGSSPTMYQEQGGANSRVEQRRHPDGSMSISIGGGNGGAGGAEGNGAGEDPSSAMNISDVSHLLLYDNGEEGDTQEDRSDKEDE